jgi:predicted short-subunit dehydrogenase-like oxidoreductase (DUF2520 family)
MAAERKGTPATRRDNRRQSPRARPKPGISIIGAGRLGTALAVALASKGYSIEAVVARRLRHARRAAALVSSEPRAFTSAQLDLLPSSDLFFITTPDDAIEQTARRLLAASTPLTSGKRGRAVVLHTSGALSSNVLNCLREAGYSTGSMHPLVSVSDASSGAESLRTAFYCIEGERVASRAARNLVRDLGAQSFSIGAKDKALYHAAAVMASGHVVALFDIAIEMLLHCGLKRSRARAVLMPLLQSTLENLSAHEPARALTGTFSRADVATVRRHLQALRRQNSPDPLAAYRLLGQRSLQLAEQSGADATALKEIELALREVVEKA